MPEGRDMDGCISPRREAVHMSSCLTDAESVLAGTAGTPHTKPSHVKEGTGCLVEIGFPFERTISAPVTPVFHGVTVGPAVCLPHSCPCPDAGRPFRRLASRCGLGARRVQRRWLSGLPAHPGLCGQEARLLAADAALRVLGSGTSLRTGLQADFVSGDHQNDSSLPSKWAITGVVMGFTLLQATDSSAVTIMALFVGQKMGGELIWAGIALGVAAALEIPALLVIGRLSRHLSGTVLITSGCMAGILYYAAMTFVADPITLLL